ncbi:MAG: hypothetical protein QM831_25850 [Kofleriaceae bacterium]
MIELPAPFVELGRRRLKNAFAILLALAVGVAALVLAIMPKPPLAGDPMQPWVVALTLFVFIGLAPMLLIRLAMKKDAEALAVLRRDGKRYAGVVTSRQDPDVVVKWTDEHQDNLARVQVPKGFTDTYVEVVAASVGKIAIIVDGALYLGLVI